MATTEKQLSPTQTESTELGYGFDTLALHAGTPPDPTTGAILTPIYQTQLLPALHRMVWLPL